MKSPKLVHKKSHDEGGQYRISKLGSYTDDGATSDQFSFKSSLEEMVTLNNDKYPSIEPITESNAQLRSRFGSLNSGSGKNNGNPAGFTSNNMNNNNNNNATTNSLIVNHQSLGTAATTVNQITAVSPILSTRSIPTGNAASKNSPGSSPKSKFLSGLFPDPGTMSSSSIKNASSINEASDQYLMLKKDVSWILMYERVIEEMISYLAAMNIYVCIWYVFEVYPEFAGLKWYKEIPQDKRDGVIQTGYALATGLMTVALFYSWLLRCGLKVHPIFRWAPLVYINICFWFLPMASLYLFRSYFDVKKQQGASFEDLKDLIGSSFTYMPLNGLSLAMAMVHYPLRLLTFRIPFHVKAILFVIQIMYPLIGFPLCMGWDLFQFYKWECLLTASCGMVCNSMAFIASHAASFYRNIVIENQILVVKRNEALNYEIGEEKRAQEILKNYTAYLFHEVRVPLNAVVFGLDNLKQMLTDIFDRVYTAKSTSNDNGGSLVQTIADDETWDGIWDTIQDLEISSNRSKVILNRVLDFHSLESGLLKINIKPFDLVEAVRDVIQMLKPISVNKEISVNMELLGNALAVNPSQHKALTVIWDCSRYQELLSNFLSNALKYTPVGGKVRVSLEAEFVDEKSVAAGGYLSYKSPKSPNLPAGGKVFSSSSQDVNNSNFNKLGGKTGSNNNNNNNVTSSNEVASGSNIDNSMVNAKLCLIKTSVVDNGPGISKRDQEKLFVPFSQIKQSSLGDHGKTQGKIGSTGLGLVICKKIIELSNGRIVVESEKGKGSSFMFELVFQTASPNNINNSNNSIHVLPTNPEIKSTLSNHKMTHSYSAIEQKANAIDESAALGKTANTLASPRLDGKPNESPLASRSFMDPKRKHDEEDEALRLNSLFNFHLGDVIQDSIRSNNPSYSPKKLLSSLRPAKRFNSNDTLSSASPPNTNARYHPANHTNGENPNEAKTGVPRRNSRSPLAKEDSYNDNTKSLSNLSSSNGSGCTAPKALDPKNIVDDSISGNQTHEHDSCYMSHKPFGVVNQNHSSRAPGASENNEDQIRILVADDDVINAKLISKNLARSGFVCTTASDGLKALKEMENAAANSRPFHVLLLDRNMPELNGMELLDRMKRNGNLKRIKVIGISGAVDSEQEEFKSHGVDKILVKPIRVEELHSSIQDLVKQYKEHK